IMKIEPKHWARAFFPVGSLCDSVDNNLCESFNNAIIEARFYPCISMLEKVRQKMTKRVQENREKSKKWTNNPICPNIFKNLK
uniref:Transposase n=1 Tax=Aegilops tauschii subsp. strangulata TaxID=200361 RepID=A0A452Y127_AEGTS